MKPNQVPSNPLFSSGPTAKHPGWSLDSLSDAILGRSHRSKPGKARIQELILRSRELLELPDDYLIGIVPASDTGAFEMALWSMLGARGVDVLSWESFGYGWETDIKKQLKLEDARYFRADYGQLPDLEDVDSDRDIVFTWNGTTSGVKVPNGDWIDANRKGLTFCDATSAVFGMKLPWDKLDVTTYSWQKALGGEAAHGILILSPHAVERLESYTPAWPLPKIFRLTKGGKLISGIFDGATINTPSMLCIEDALDAVKWGDSVGGLNGMIARSTRNFDAVAKWVGETSWVDFLAEAPETRSPTSICLKIVDPGYQNLPEEEQAAIAKSVTKLLDDEGVAYDIGAYRDAPAGFRLWGGATVDTADLEALFPWLDWAFGEVMQQQRQAA